MNEECEHNFGIPTIFEEPPNGDDGAWCSAAQCKLCGMIMVFNSGLGRFENEYLATSDRS